MKRKNPFEYNLPDGATVQKLVVSSRLEMIKTFNAEQLEQVLAMPASEVQKAVAAAARRRLKELQDVKP